MLDASMLDASTLDANTLDASQGADAPSSTADGAATADAGGCLLSRDGITAGSGQVLVIQSVSFADDTIVVRNIGGSPVSFTPDGSMGQPSWRVYVDTQATGHDLPAGFSIAAGATVRIHLKAAGTNDAENIFLSWTAQGADLRPQTAGDGAEAAILAPNNGNSDPAAMQAYVRWGGDDAIGATHTLRDEAAAAGMWVGNNPGDFVWVFETDVGITITSDGDATNPASWTNTSSASCL